MATIGKLHGGGCRGVIREGTCDRCGPIKREEYRPNARERGYDWEWEKLRTAYLNGHAVCEDCDTRGETALASEVHHVKGVKAHPELRLIESNLAALCSDCHDRRHGGKGRRGTPHHRGG